MSHEYEEEDFQKRLDWPLWKKIIQRMTVYRRLVLPLIIVSVAIAGAETLMTLMTKVVIDEVTLHEGARLVLWAGVLGALTVFNAVGVWLFIRLAGTISVRMSCDVRKDAFEKLQRQEFAFFDQRPVGWLMARLTSDCDRMGRILAWGTLDIVLGSCKIAGIALFMLILNWKLGLLVLTVMPVVAWISLRFQKRILRTSREMTRTNSRITASYAEGISGVRTTKSLVREEKNLNEFKGLSGHMYNVSRRNALYTAAYLPLVLTIVSIGTGLALWKGGVDVMTGAITLGTLIAFIAGTSEIVWPIFEMARIFAELQNLQASAERIFGLIERKPAIVNSAEVLDRIEKAAHRPQSEKEAHDGGPAGIDSVEFDNVHFSYKEDQPVLSDFNLKVRAGETIALVGPTGGGKSTVISLLCRFYEPTGGSVLLNGRDYRERSLQWLYGNLGIVQQDPRLFSGTLRENIRYGRLDATDAEVEEAARRVNAEGFIRKLRNGYETQVGEGGVRLSTGQKQLISLGRAMLADPQIMILDEATASIDTRTEQVIQKSVEEVLAERISFVIAHRLSTIRSADRILLIDAGRIVEEGSHTELLRRKGRYHELYLSQFRSTADLETIQEQKAS